MTVISCRERHSLNASPLLARLPATPDTKDNDFFILPPVGVTQNITGSAKRDDQFTDIATDARRPAALRKGRECLNGSNKASNGAIGSRCVFVQEKSVKSCEVGRGRRRDDEFHNLRGVGCGSSFGLPQLSIQTFTSSHGTPTRVRSN